MCARRLRCVPPNSQSRRASVMQLELGVSLRSRLKQVFFDDLEIRPPDYFLDAAERTPAATIAAVITRSDGLFEQIRPDALLIYGDTNSGLCVIPAKRRRIPVFHMEAGNRCFD